MKHRITYDGRRNSLPCHCEECGKFAGYMKGGNKGYEYMDEEDCPGPPPPAFERIKQTITKFKMFLTGRKPA